MECGGASITVWGCFVAVEPKQIVISDASMHSGLHQEILQKNVRSFIYELNENFMLILQQDNLKHSKQSY